jgi:hypothetical protein
MKSHVSSLLELATCIYKDAVAKCTDVLLDERDLDTMRRRSEHEGISFLTITLPSLGTDFDRSLAEGRIGSGHFRSFRKRLKAPAFLQGFFNQVFDEEGRILNEPSIEAIEGIRQIANSFRKLRYPCSPVRVARTLTKFAQVEHEAFSVQVSEDDVARFRHVCRVLWHSVFSSDVDYVSDAVPKHGPGATADRLSGNRKFYHRTWHDRLEPYFPLLDFAFANADGRYSEEFEKLSVIDAEQEQPVRVIPVPKTLKGPRIIAIEPVCMQYTQQALSSVIIPKLETHYLTAGHVNFTDQSINRELALSSSKSGKLVTIDLSAASDRVPLDLSLLMFGGNPDLQDAIQACRSTRAQMPGGGIIPLQKFASMGSALCFPVEAMYFYTLCVMALMEERNLPLTTRSAYTASRDVYVYGDDIIVPVNESEAVIRTLQKYYCKVNTDKSFVTGKFRESCGMDAYSGEEVTPTYVRTTPPDNRRSAPELVSWVSTSNLFYRKGYWKTSSHMTKLCERYLGNLPIVSPTSSGLGKESFQSYVSADRWSKRFHRHEVLAWVVSPVYSSDAIDGHPALVKCLLKLHNGLLGDRAPDAKHLTRTARHGAVTLKRRWVASLS